MDYDHINIFTVKNFRTLACKTVQDMATLNYFENITSRKFQLYGSWPNCKTGKLHKMLKIVSKLDSDITIGTTIKLITSWNSKHKINVKKSSNSHNP